MAKDSAPWRVIIYYYLLWLLAGLVVKRNVLINWRRIFKFNALAAVEHTRRLRGKAINLMIIALGSDRVLPKWKEVVFLVSKQSIVWINAICNRFISLFIQFLSANNEWIYDPCGRPLLFCITDQGFTQRYSCYWSLCGWCCCSSYPNAFESAFHLQPQCRWIKSKILWLICGFWWKQSMCANGGGGGGEEDASARVTMPSCCY